MLLLRSTEGACMHAITKSRTAPALLCCPDDVAAEWASVDITAQSVPPGGHTSSVHYMQGMMPGCMMPGCMHQHWRWHDWLAAR